MLQLQEDFWIILRYNTCRSCTYMENTPQSSSSVKLFFFKEIYLFSRPLCFCFVLFRYVTERILPDGAKIWILFSIGKILLVNVTWEHKSHIFQLPSKFSFYYVDKVTVSANSRDSKVVNDCINILTSEDMENTPHGSWTKFRISFKFSSLTLVSIKKKTEWRNSGWFSYFGSCKLLFFMYFRNFPILFPLENQMYAITETSMDRPWRGRQVRI